MSKAWTVFWGTVQRLVLRFMVRASENAWINAESRLLDAELSHEETIKRLSRCRRLANATREAHCRWQHRLSPNSRGVPMP